MKRREINITLELKMASAIALLFCFGAAFGMMSLWPVEVLVPVLIWTLRATLFIIGWGMVLAAIWLSFRWVMDRD